MTDDNRHPKGDIFAALGDVARMGADAIAFPANQGEPGRLWPAFCRNVPEFEERYERAHREYLETHGKLTVGDTFWVPVEGGPGRPQGVVAVVVTVSAPDPGGVHPAYRAVERAVTCAIEALRRNPDNCKRRLRIAIPPLRMGAGGDRFQRLESARAQIDAARHVIDRHEGPPVDVAFVAYTPDIYDIYLDVRREKGQRPAIDHDLMPRDLVNAVRESACVVFVGAGLSQGASLPGYEDLQRRMAERLSLAPDHRYDPLDLAQWYREGFDDLPDLIRETYGAHDALPSLAHYLLMGLPLRHVVTTNYDGLLETALDAQRRNPETVVRQEDVALSGRRDATYVVKLHGDAQHGDDGLVIARDDYDGFFEKRPVMATLLEGLLLNQTFFFVGYSLRDPNFRQIYSRIDRMLREAKRPAFAVTFEPYNEFLWKQWANKGVRLLEMRGADREEKAHCLLRLLDRLSEAAAGRARLFLASDARPDCKDDDSWSLRPLADALLQVGDEVVRATERDLNTEEILQVARTLSFLAENGWRRREAPLTRLWESLAENLDPSERGLRRNLLLTALRHTEGYEEVVRLREKLEAL